MVDGRRGAGYAGLMRPAPDTAVEHWLGGQPDAGMFISAITGAEFCEAVGSSARVLIGRRLERGDAPGQVVCSRVAMVGR